MKKFDLIEVKSESFPRLVGERFIAECLEFPHLDFFGYTVDFDNQRFILSTKHVNILERNIMWFETLEDVKTYFNEYRAKNKGAKNINYSVTAKKAFVEFMQRNEISVTNCAKVAGVSTFSIKHWREQYNDGLYNDLDAVTKVSMKTKKTHSSAVEHLKELKEKLRKDHEQEIININLQISAIKTLEEKGFTITKAA